MIVRIEVVYGGMIVIVECLCSSIGTLQSYLMLFSQYTSCKCNLHRETFLIFNVLFFTSSFLLMGIVYSQFFYYPQKPIGSLWAEGDKWGFDEDCSYDRNQSSSGW